MRQIYRFLTSRHDPHGLGQVKHQDAKWSGLPCSTLRLDRIRPRMSSAAELAQFWLRELSFEQSSPSLARTSLLGLSGALASADS